MFVYLSELFLLEITFMIIIYSNYFCSTYTFSYVVIWRHPNYNFFRLCTVTQHQGPQTTVSQAISSGPQRHFINNEKITYLRKILDLVECNISRKIDIA